MSYQQEPISDNLFFDCCEKLIGFDSRKYKKYCSITEIVTQKNEYCLLENDCDMELMKTYGYVDRYLIVPNGVVPVDSVIGAIPYVTVIGYRLNSKGLDKLSNSIGIKIRLASKLVKQTEDGIFNSIQDMISNSGGDSK